MTKIIQPGSPDASSFNDDSSPDSRLTSNLKVSVNAQVVPEKSLDWFYGLLQLCQSIPGELKSAEVWDRFRTLDGKSKDLIWTGLSKVRIHIVDPRPYRKSFDEILRKMLPSENPSEFLRQQVRTGEPQAIILLNRLHVFTAERIISDSVGSRVHSLSRYLNEYLVPSGSIDPLSDQEEVLDLREFGNDIKPLVRKVTQWAAKSAATFHEALDGFLELEEPVRYFPNELVRIRMRARVLKTHTFDKGDDRQLELLENARGSILRNLANPGMPAGEREVKLYSQTDSKDSFLVQAADIAAGIASKILETQNLVAVVSRFEYVTYNGSRLSISDAEEEIRRMS